jgi:hypothetical protein
VAFEGKGRVVEEIMRRRLRGFGNEIGDESGGENVFDL